jgi:hypothetical protein
VSDHDNLDQPEGEESASASAPATAAPDLEAIVRKVFEDSLKPELDSRFSGLQSVQDKRLAKLAQELRSSSMTPDEQEAVLEQERSQEQEKALRIAELIKRRKTAPEAVDFLLESMEKADLDEQVEFIQSVLAARSQTPAPAAPATGDESDEEGQIPESNKNNPASNRSAQLESGEEMNEELADAILDQVGKGQFGRFFGRR